LGYLDFDHEKRHLSIIRRALFRRGLAPDLDELWEIHGPHQEMSYQVYVGYAIPKNEKQTCSFNSCKLPWVKCKEHPNFCCVAIYPRAVYEIEKPSDWYKNNPENRIAVLREA
jgi:hypothetical protein